MRRGFSWVIGVAVLGVAVIGLGRYMATKGHHNSDSMAGGITSESEAVLIVGTCGTSIFLILGMRGGDGYSTGVMVGPHPKNIIAWTTAKRLRHFLNLCVSNLILLC